MWEDEHCNNPSKSPFFWRDWWHYYLHLLFFPPPQVWTKSEQPSNVSRNHPILSRLCSKSSNDRCNHYSHLLLKSAIRNVCWSVLLPSSRAVAEILLRLREKIMYSKLTNDGKKNKYGWGTFPSFLSNLKVSLGKPKFKQQIQLPLHEGLKFPIPHSSRATAILQYSLLSVRACAEGNAMVLWLYGHKREVSRTE